MVGKNRHQLADEIMDTLGTVGRYEGRDHTMTIDVAEKVASVVDRRTGRLVAYSAAKSDFSDSVAEFVYDFMV